MGIFKRFLDTVEWLGNKLPHPFMIFVYLAIIAIGLSWLASLFGAAVEDPGSGEMVAVENMISGAGLEFILTSMIDNFVEFPPLGIILGVMLGIGLAQKAGLIETAMQKAISSAPRSLVTYVVILTGVLGNLASDAAYVVVPPLAALAFLSVGRHPLAGMAAGFAAVGAGFTANFIVAGTDALLSGISTEAARIVDAEAAVTPVDNYYFMAFSVLMLVIVGGLVTERIVEPRLGEYRGSSSDRELEETTPQENRGLRNAAIAAAVYLGAIVAATIPANSPLRGEEGGLVPSTLLDGIVPIILFFFVIVAVTYGITAGTVRNVGDVPRLMGEAMKDMSTVIVLIFAAAQFIAYFEFFNLGIWVAVNGAEFLESVQFTGLPVIIAFILLVTLLNLLITSGSAQWALMAPIFVPLFTLLDFDPALTQLAFRIGDSSTNIITPTSPYVAMMLAFMREYDEEAGFGTLLSMMLPYTLLFLGSWILIFIAWYLIGIPIGPGVSSQPG